jgi:hypothetical protein
MLARRPEPREPTTQRRTAPLLGRGRVPAPRGRAVDHSERHAPTGVSARRAAGHRLRHADVERSLADSVEPDACCTSSRCSPFSVSYRLAAWGSARVHLGPRTAGRCRPPGRHIRSDADRHTAPRRVSRSRRRLFLESARLAHRQDAAVASSEVAVASFLHSSGNSVIYTPESRFVTIAMDCRG